VTFVLPDTGQWLDLDAKLVRTSAYPQRVEWAVQRMYAPASGQRLLRRYVYFSVSTSAALSRSRQSRPGARSRRRLAAFGKTQNRINFEHLEAH
jgi:hypothetical protein